MQQTRVALAVRVNADFAATEQRVIDLLKAEGFGVITEVDMQATFKDKLDVDFRAYKILGACNPKMAYHVLDVEPSAGLLLPCNVVVEQVEDETVMVSFVDPAAMLELVGNRAVEPIAEQVRQHMTNVAEALEQGV